MKVDYDGSVIRKDQHDDEPHADRYPMPPWLARWTGRAPENVRRLTVDDFPLDNYRGEMVKAVDGDTIEVDLILKRGDRQQLGRQPVRERIRLLGFNALELNQDGGHAAKEALAAMIPVGTVVYLHLYEERRSFNRMLAWAYAKGTGPQLLDVAAAMIASGHGTKA